MRAWLPRPTSVPIRPPTSRPATTVLRQRNVPEAIRSLSTLAKPDYVDLFTVTTGAAADSDDVHERSEGARVRRP